MQTISKGFRAEMFFVCAPLVLEERSPQARQTHGGDVRSPQHGRQYTSGAFNCCPNRGILV